MMPQRAMAWGRANKEILLNSSSLIATTGITSVLGFVYWAVAARLFSTEAYGIASAAISAMMLTGTLCNLGLGTLLLGELPRNPGRAGALVATALVISGGLAGLMGGLFAILAPLVSPELAAFAASPAVIALFAAGALFTALAMVTDQGLVGMLWGELQLTRNSAFAAIKLVALWPAAMWLAAGGGVTIYTTWLLGNLASLALVAALVAGRGRRLIHAPDWSLLRRFSGKALRHYALNLALGAPAFALPILVTIQLSAEINALFYSSWMLASFSYIVPAHLTTVLHTVGARNRPLLASKMRLTLGLSLAVGAASALFLMLFADMILGLFGDVYAAEGGWALRILGLAVFSYIIKYHYVVIRRIDDEVGPAAIVVVIGSVIELSAATIGASMGGLVGLCLGWMAASSAEAAYMLPRVWRTLHAR